MNKIQKYRIRWGIILFFLCLGIQSVRGQINENLTKYLPVTPEVAQMVKHIDIPVNHSTGIPNIQIPIYVLKGKKIDVPITLSYDASGIKVGNVAGRVGQGWTLNAGGKISRVVRGIPDDYADPGLKTFGVLTHDAASKFTNLRPNGDYDFDYIMKNPELYQMHLPTMAREIVNGYGDALSDMYYFSAPHLSGKFIFDNNDIPIVVPYNNIRIDYDQSKDLEFYQDKEFSFNINGVYGGYYPIKTVTIYNSNGIKYTFGGDGKTNMVLQESGYNGALTSMENRPSGNGIKRNFYTNIWHLNTIEFNGEKVTYSYESLDAKLSDWSGTASQYYGIELDDKPKQSFKYEYDVEVSKVLKKTTCPSFLNQNLSVNYSKQTYIPRLTKKIKTEKGEVEFFYAYARNDIKGEKALTKIVVRNNLNKKIKEFYFYYTQIGARYFLKKITQKDILNNSYYDLYNFEYYDEESILSQFPDYYSQDQTDYWGYWNLGIGVYICKNIENGDNELSSSNGFDIKAKDDKGNAISLYNPITTNSNITFYLDRYAGGLDRPPYTGITVEWRVLDLNHCTYTNTATTGSQGKFTPMNLLHSGNKRIIARISHYDKQYQYVNAYVSKEISFAFSSKESESTSDFIAPIRLSFPSIKGTTFYYKYKNHLFEQALSIDNGYDKSPDLRTTKTGTLKKITYPTGGETKFEYTLHDYYNEDEDKNVQIGGLRIKRITNTSKENPKGLIKEFEYIKNISYTANGLQKNSSGQVYFDYTDYPFIYFCTKEQTDAYWGLIYVPRYTNSSNILNDASGKPVLYSNVRIKENGITRKKLTYTNYSDYHDSLGKMYKYFFPESSLETFAYDTDIGGIRNIKHEFFYPIELMKISHAWKRGKIISEENYYTKGQTSFRLNKKSYRYKDIPTQKNVSILEVKMPNISASSTIYIHHFNLPIQNQYLFEIKEEMYDKTNPYLVQTNIIRYNNYNEKNFLPVEKVITFSNNLNVKEIYTYPFNKTESVYKEMKARHMISPIIAKKVYYAGSLIEHQKTEYSIFPASSLSSLKKILPRYKKTYDFKTGKWEIIEEYNYDHQYSNLASYTPYKDNSVSFKWNAKYKHTLLTDVLLGNYSINYKYIPLVGIDKMTYIDNLNTYYAYGNYQDLSLVKNNDKRITDRYVKVYSNDPFYKPKVTINGIKRWGEKIEFRIDESQYKYPSETKFSWSIEKLGNFSGKKVETNFNSIGDFEYTLTIAHPDYETKKYTYTMHIDKALFGEYSYDLDGGKNHYTYPYNIRRKGRKDADSEKLGVSTNYSIEYRVNKLKAAPRDVSIEWKFPLPSKTIIKNMLTPVSYVFNDPKSAGSTHEISATLKHEFYEPYTIHINIKVEKNSFDNFEITYKTTHRYGDDIIVKIPSTFSIEYPEGKLIKEVAPKDVKLVWQSEDTGEEKKKFETSLLGKKTYYFQSEGRKSVRASLSHKYYDDKIIVKNIEVKPMPLLTPEEEDKTRSFYFNASDMHIGVSAKKPIRIGDPITFSISYPDVVSQIFKDQFPNTSSDILEYAFKHAIKMAKFDWTFEPLEQSQKVGMTKEVIHSFKTGGTKNITATLDLEATNFEPITLKTTIDVEEPCPQPSEAKIEYFDISTTPAYRYSNGQKSQQPETALHGKGEISGNKIIVKVDPKLQSTDFAPLRAGITIRLSKRAKVYYESREISEIGFMSDWGNYGGGVKKAFTVVSCDKSQKNTYTVELKYSE